MADPALLGVPRAGGAGMEQARKASWRNWHLHRGQVGMRGQSPSGAQPV